MLMLSAEYILPVSPAPPIVPERYLLLAVRLALGGCCTAPKPRRLACSALVPPEGSSILYRLWRLMLPAPVDVMARRRALRVPLPLSFPCEAGSSSKKLTRWPPATLLRLLPPLLLFNTLSRLAEALGTREDMRIDARPARLARL